jgi:hypothetical protein
MMVLRRSVYRAVRWPPGDLPYSSPEPVSFRAPQLPFVPQELFQIWLAIAIPSTPLTTHQLAQPPAL